MLRKLVVALAVLAIAAPAFALVASKDGSMVTTPNGSPVDQPLGDRADVEFNTGGAMFTAATTNGSASGWAYYTVHVYTNTAAQDLAFLELGFPTNEYSADPIVMPVEWNIDLNNGDYMTVINPYTHAWDGVGTFYPTGVVDTSPPTVYSVIDIAANNLVLPAGAAMVLRPDRLQRRRDHRLVCELLGQRRALRPHRSAAVHGRLSDDGHRGCLPERGQEPLLVSSGSSSSRR
jgi:hypothetical protein